MTAPTITIGRSWRFRRLIRVVSPPATAKITATESAAFHLVTIAIVFNLALVQFQIKLHSSSIMATAQRFLSNYLSEGADTWPRTFGFPHGNPALQHMIAGPKNAYN